MAETDLYANLGVDAGKAEVRSSFGSVIDNDFPGAFVNIIRDPEIPGLVHTLHGDGDGSKSIQRVLCYLETHDPTVFTGAVDDAVAMNMGDIAACGFVSGLTKWSDIINIRDIPDAVPKRIIMETFAQRFAELKQLHRDYGFPVYFLGGETADLPDQVGTSVFDVTVDAREKEENIITGNVQVGDLIYGLASDGQALWEDRLNSGIMSNGLTLGATCTMWDGYNERYPFLRLKNPYRGRYKVGEYDDLLREMPVSEAVMSSTRQWSILIRGLINELKQRDILHMLHGISLNTGGGATKIGRVGNGILYRKKNMPTPPGIFKLIQREGDVSWKEMFRDFNCGVGVDVVGQDHVDFDAALRSVARATYVKLYSLGHTERYTGGGNKVVLETPHGTFDDY